jgi:hypothetical protein
MSTQVIGGALVTIRTARTRHWCGPGRHWIEPGERYEDWRLPPWRDVNESPRWWKGQRHWDGGSPHRWACDKAAAYREHAERMPAS